MSSRLKAKLGAMRSSQVSERQNRPTGLIYHISRCPVDACIYDLPGTGLRRIGWNGTKFDIKRCLFLDTETTGLSHGAGTVAFLVGAGHMGDSDMIVEQFLMRDYASEPELIDRLSLLMNDYDSVCTFNGKTFDMPLLETRFTMCRMRDRWRDLHNLDLVIPARRAWKLRLGSCRLSSLEEQILGLPRKGDLPGSEVPARYFEYLRTGNEDLLSDIIEHNRQDIVTLSTLLIKLCQINDKPERLSDQRDLFSMGKALERQGEFKPARELYRLSAIPRPTGTLSSLHGIRIAGMANWQLYLLHRRNGDTQSMRSVLEQMLNRGQLRDQVCVELSKLYEHRFLDPKRAMEYALLAKKCASSISTEALDRRIERLQRKINSK